MSLEVKNTTIEGLVLIRPARYEDERGYFSETFSDRDFACVLGDGAEPVDFVQDNESVSKASVIRGLHFQVPPKPMGKLVRVLSGSIIDVAVDLRKDSPTYGKHEAVRLDTVEGWQFYIPPGFAHGFASLEEDTKVAYKCTEFYAPECEQSILFNDEDLAIDWGVKEPIVSEKDLRSVKFSDFKSPF
ncbi:MAG: dTDP-4-dehydrorhamnose 3,5-epimerase [Crocinitomicaceae bacterium]|nr:dTDP-4-dehydrorhamnose 3,5-epimerase [Crocinitomicaceae bacterium]